MKSGPDFICIGSQKAGTGTLYNILRAHRDCSMPRIKELHYFDLQSETRIFTRVTQRLERLKRKAAQKSGFENHARFVDIYLDAALNGRTDVETYRRMFDTINDRVTGDVTPFYAILPEDKVAGIAAGLPEVKILYVIRDPVSRLWSHARMLAERSGRPITSDLRTFAQFCDWDDVKARSLQSRTIRLWREHFGDRLHILFFDDLRDRPEEYLAQVATILGIGGNPDDTSSDLHENRKAKPSEPMPDDIRRHAREVMREEYEQLADLAGGHAKEWLEKVSRPRVAVAGAPAAT
ncbi:sulfotransferase [Microbaculum marinum]|uniref:Sulfotransferase n=1 Tax=Microbaculum marinum TaxID=1764581 RepID=A0AAW9RTV9_9HYPH